MCTQPNASTLTHEPSGTEADYVSPTTLANRQPLRLRRIIAIDPRVSHEFYRRSLRVPLQLHGRHERESGQLAVQFEATVDDWEQHRGATTNDARN